MNVFTDYNSVVPKAMNIFKLLLLGSNFCYLYHYLLLICPRLMNFRYVLMKLDKGEHLLHVQKAVNGRITTVELFLHVPLSERHFLPVQLEREAHVDEETILSRG